MTWTNKFYEDVELIRGTVKTIDNLLNSMDEDDESGLLDLRAAERRKELLKRAATSVPMEDWMFEYGVPVGACDKCFKSVLDSSYAAGRLKFIEKLYVMRTYKELAEAEYCSCKHRMDKYIAEWAASKALLLDKAAREKQPTEAAASGGLFKQPDPADSLASQVE